MVKVTRRRNEGGAYHPNYREQHDSEGSGEGWCDDRGVSVFEAFACRILCALIAQASGSWGGDQRAEDGRQSEKRTRLVHAAIELAGDLMDGLGYLELRQPATETQSSSAQPEGIDLAAALGPVAELLEGEDRYEPA
jgi:hypothetical protein